MLALAWGRGNLLVLIRLYGGVLFNRVSIPLHGISLPVHLLSRCSGIVVNCVILNSRFYTVRNAQRNRTPSPYTPGIKCSTEAPKSNPECKLIDHGVDLMDLANRAASAPAPSHADPALDCLVLGFFVG